jgi:hypothetical protein
LVSGFFGVELELGVEVGFGSGRGPADTSR